MTEIAGLNSVTHKLTHPKAPRASCGPFMQIAVEFGKCRLLCMQVADAVLQRCQLSMLGCQLRQPRAMRKWNGCCLGRAQQPSTRYLHSA